MKVYVLIKCESCLGEYNDDPEVIGVYRTLEKIKEKLKELKFNENQIEALVKRKWTKVWNNVFDYFYYLEETTLN